jgi:hypothetical protein
MQMIPTSIVSRSCQLLNIPWQNSITDQIFHLPATPTLTPRVYSNLIGCGRFGANGWPILCPKPVCALYLLQFRLDRGIVWFV